jgi:hypothetical protein
MIRANRHTSAPTAISNVRTPLSSQQTRARDLKPLTSLEHRGVTPPNLSDPNHRHNPVSLLGIFTRFPLRSGLGFQYTVLM